jgi:hypothetical protein
MAVVPLAVSVRWSARCGALFVAAVVFSASTDRLPSVFVVSGHGESPSPGSPRSRLAARVSGNPCCDAGAAALGPARSDRRVRAVGGPG